MLTPARILAETMGREQIAEQDVQVPTAPAHSSRRPAAAPSDRTGGRGEAPPHGPPPPPPAPRPSLSPYRSPPALSPQPATPQPTRPAVSPGGGPALLRRQGVGQVAREVGGLPQIAPLLILLNVAVRREEPPRIAYRKPPCHRRSLASLLWRSLFALAVALACSLLAARRGYMHLLPW